MVELPPLNEVDIVRLSKEGGLAYIPGLAQRRIFELASCSEVLRRQVCHALEEARARAQSPSSTGNGDQRFFRIELDSGASPAVTVYRFEVPETDAPLALAELLQVALSEGGVSAGDRDTNP